MQKDTKNNKKAIGATPMAILIKGVVSSTKNVIHCINDELS